MEDPIRRLHSLLESFEPTGEEAGAVAATLRLIERQQESFDADFFDPGHVTASAFVIDPTSTKLLLIHHRKLWTWLQPGGHIDRGEDVLDAAIREVEEETGVRGVPVDRGIFDVDVHDIPASSDRPAHQHFDVRFLLRAKQPHLAGSDEVLDVRWVPLDEVAELVVDRSVLRTVAKLNDH